MSDNDDNDDGDKEFSIPLQDQRVFGAGLKLKRVKFVSSANDSHAITTVAQAAHSAKDISNAYLDLVLPNRASVRDVVQKTSESTAEVTEVCEICHIPILYTSVSTPHDASLAHQICLPHSYPPSAIDRKRKGLSILASQGWDPDARLGLGSRGQGRTVPIKTTFKDDKLGVGVVIPKDELMRRATKRTLEKEAKKKLDAGKVRKLYAEDWKRKAELQRAFYGRDDTERYFVKSKEWS